jgi:hypothetical protein
MPFSKLTDQQLQCCHYWHLKEARGTREVEAQGRYLMNSNVALCAADLLKFSWGVCKWGGKTGARVFGRIRRNSEQTIVEGFTAAIAELRHSNPDLLAAKQALGAIKGLGAFSYSSKHLRMLSPEISPVLDGVVDTFLARNDTRCANSTIERRFLGYADFCRAKADQLARAGVMLGDFLVPADLCKTKTTSDPSKCRWTAADIDMACFAWLKGWCAGMGASTNASTPTRAQSGPSTRAPTEAKRVATADAHNNLRPTIYLAQDHKWDTAVTIKEYCGRRWNNAWICRTHGSLDFKSQYARGNTRYLIGEIGRQGVDVTQDLRWVASDDGKTCHHGGSSYQGRLCMGSVADAVRFLKQFFVVRACRANRNQTQAWIDAL